MSCIVDTNCADVCCVLISDSVDMLKVLLDVVCAVKCVVATAADVSLSVDTEEVDECCDDCGADVDGTVPLVISIPTVEMSSGVIGEVP